MEQDDPNNPAGLQQGLAAADAQPSGDVGQVCETCPNNWVEAGAVDETTGEPLPGLGYRIYDMASGDQVASGILDEKGESPRHQIDMPITQLYVIFGTEEAMDAAEEQIGEKQREHALQQNAVSEWRGIPAGLDEGEFNQAYDRIAYEAGRYEKPSVSFFQGAAYGANMLWDYVSSGFDSGHMLNELYLDDRRRNFEQYQLATNAREASDAESFFGGGGQGLTFGFGEEGMARLDSLFSDRSYDELVAERRQLNRAQQIANPNWYIGGEIAGAVPTIFVPVGGAAANAARAGQGIRGAVVAGARTGAATGAVSGAGHDEGGVLDRLDGAALGAATGGLAGAVLSGAGVLIARGMSRTRIWGRIAARRSGKFDDLQPMDRNYIGEETGSVWGTRVQYLDEEARKAYQLQFRDGKVYDSRRNLFDTSDTSTAFGGGKAIFVMDDAGNVYASKSHSVGKFHHSSFLSGGPVASAGEISVENGVIREVTRRSGHYQPTVAQLNQFVSQLSDEGVNTGAIRIGDGF